jgi:hypothetical protein
MISQSGAYSRLERPSGARGLFGRKRFQRPAARASTFKRSTTSVGVQALPAARLSAISCRNTRSFG